MPICTGNSNLFWATLLFPVAGIRLETFKDRARNYKSTLGKTATSPLVILRLWSSCVLVHATQYLRYIANPAHINEIQVEINASIQHAMGCHNFPTPLLADLGIPTMEYHRQLDLCRIHFRHTQTQCPKQTSEIYKFRQASKLAVEPKDLEVDVLEACQHIFPAWQKGQPLPVPKHLYKTLPSNKEKSFAKYLRPLVSELWRQEIFQKASLDKESRLGAYTNLAAPDLCRKSLFHPAAYILTDSRVSINALIKLRTQHQKYVPTHDHLGRESSMGGDRKQYRDRVCPYCGPPTVAGSEAHYLTTCTATSTIRNRPLRALKHVLHYLALDPWDTFTQEVHVQLLCGSALPPEWKASAKKQRYSAANVLPHCAITALQLHQYLKSRGAG